MPVRSSNNIAITQDWVPAASFEWPYGPPGVNKITCYATTDVILQVIDDPETGWIEDQTLEILLRVGFNSRDFITPVRKWRFRVWPDTTLATTGTIDMVAMS